MQCRHAISSFPESRVVQFACVSIGSNCLEIWTLAARTTTQEFKLQNTLGTFISTITGFLLLEMQNIEINDATVEEKAMDTTEQTEEPKIVRKNSQHFRYKNGNQVVQNMRRYSRSICHGLQPQENWW